MEVIEPLPRRIAIAGLGSIGRRHARLIKLLDPNVELVFIRSGVGKAWPELDLGLATVSSISEALDYGVSSAIISSPAPYHLPQANDFVASGVPLLIEKPLSHNLFGMLEFKNLVALNQATILMGYTFRHSAAAKFFFECLGDQSKGKPLSANLECKTFMPKWRPGRDYRETVSAKASLGGGVLLELSHELDYANWFFGPFLDVRAKIYSEADVGINVETRAQLELMSTSGLPVSVSLDFWSASEQRQCVLKMTGGDLIWNLQAQTVTWNEIGGKSKTWLFENERDDIYVSQLEHFFRCVSGEEKPRVTLEDGISALKLIEAAKLADRNCAAVKL